MRKKQFGLFIILVIAIIAIKKTNLYSNIIKDAKNTSDEVVLGETVTAKPIEENLKTKYLYSFIAVNPEKLVIIDNLELHKTSVEVQNENKCSFLINGGFYLPNYLPTGLVIIDGKKKYSYQKNSLLNGIFSINDFATPRITYDIPRDTLYQAIQSGPVIKENGRYVKGNWNNNTGRRVLAAVDGENKLYFILLYDKDSAYSGPTLNELEPVLVSIEENEQITFADILNLDGGSASVFVTPNMVQREISLVGTFICIKE